MPVTQKDIYTAVTLFLVSRLKKKSLTFPMTKLFGLVSGLLYRYSWAGKLAETWQTHLLLRHQTLLKSMQEKKS